MYIFEDLLLQLAIVATLIFTFQIFFVEKLERSSHAGIVQAVLFGISILLYMSFPAYIDSGVRIDIRIVPLLLGTLYGGWRTGLFLSALIVLYRLYLGGDLGFYTTVLTLLFGMPVIVFFQKIFMKAQRSKRIQVTLMLSAYYSFVGGISALFVREFSFGGRPRG